MARSTSETADLCGRKPPWLKTTLPEPASLSKMERLLRARGLHTVCESALCPNLGTCFAHGTATFLILGDVCTRGCRFCGVTSGVPCAVDPLEPAHVADAAASLALQHVVVTSVTRDDLTDGGAGHYVATIRAVRERLPWATAEVLVPDFGGDPKSADLVLAEAPEVFNHNVETVPRLYADVRPQAEYARSLGLLLRAAERGESAVKAGLMVGVGEREAEVAEVLRELAGVGVNIVTIGQYLRPGRHSLPVAEYVHPEVFEHYVEVGEQLGLLVHAGPVVRSSFQAGETLAKMRQRRGKSGHGELQ